MIKPKRIDIGQTNIANLGSDLEKKVKLASASGEHAWKGVGQKPGLAIWRIEKFLVHPWPENQYGIFYSGDSYIVLNTYKKGDQFKWDVHFWLGAFTTLDEAGTAAYKTVELDDVLGGAPVQHREVQGHETQLFLSYFKDPPMHILEGGIESGFHHVKPEDYKPRLLHLKGRLNHVQVTQVEFAVSSINSGDVFILDSGKIIYQWNGSKSNPSERARAAKLTQALENERENIKVHVIDEGDSECNDFYVLVGGKASDVKSAAEGGDDVTGLVKHNKQLWKLVEQSGNLTFAKIAEGSIKKSHLDPKHVLIFDAGPQVFAWIGSGASVEERHKSLRYAEAYLQDQKLPLHTPIARILAGAENEVFLSFFD